MRRMAVILLGLTVHYARHAGQVVKAMFPA
jgi:hypothetical protein